MLSATAACLAHPALHPHPLHPESAPSSFVMLPADSHWRQSKPWHRSLPQTHLGMSQHMPHTRSVPGAEANQAPLHPDTLHLPAARAQSQWSCSGMSSGGTTDSSQCYSPPTWRKEMCCGASSCFPVVPEDADTGHSGAHHRAGGSGPWGDGVWETKDITHVGCFGRAAEEMLAVMGCRGSGEMESWCFGTSLDVKSGLWEGRRR